MLFGRRLLTCVDEALTSSMSLSLSPDFKEAFLVFFQTSLSTVRWQHLDYCIEDIACLCIHVYRVIYMIGDSYEAEI